MAAAFLFLIAFLPSMVFDRFEALQCPAPPLFAGKLQLSAGLAYEVGNGVRQFERTERNLALCHHCPTSTAADPGL